MPENVDFPAFINSGMTAEAAGSHLDLRSRSMKPCRIDQPEALKILDFQLFVYIISFLEIIKNHLIG